MKRIYNTINKIKIFRPFLVPVKWLYDYYRCNFLSERYFIKKTYKSIFGRYPNLETPRTFTEKTQWLKLNERTTKHTLCADKYKVREYVKKCIGDDFLIPLVFASSNVDDINIINIPDYPVVIKTNHDSGGVYFIRNKHETNFKAIRKELSKRLKNNYYKQNKEWQYKNIERKIVVEKLLLDENYNIPNDIKIHCFNGKAKIIQIDIDRFSNHRRNLYDENWNLLPFTWSPWVDGEVKFKNGNLIEKPNNLEELKSLAERLASEFSYARVDLYNVDGTIFFGEITFHHGSGYEKIYPYEWDVIVGSFLKLPEH